jgi:hypothetical protein
MIPLDKQRAAHRQATINRIAGWPSPARFRSIADLQVFTSIPRQSRTILGPGSMRVTDLECEIALPLTEKRPEPEQEEIEILDQSGDYRTYVITTVDAMRGDRCFKLGLRSRANRPVRPSPVPLY